MNLLKPIKYKGENLQYEDYCKIIADGEKKSFKALQAAEWKYAKTLEENVDNRGRLSLFTGIRLSIPCLPLILKKFLYSRRFYIVIMLIYWRKDWIPGPFILRFMI